MTDSELNAYLREEALSGNFPTQHVGGRVSCATRLEILRKFFSRILCEDSQDGTIFDGEVFDVIEELERKYKEK